MSEVMDKQLFQLALAPLSESSLGSDLPLVSVITPVYNAAAVLDGTVASMQSQSYPNLEIILIDTDSTDESAEIIRRYCELDRRCKGYFINRSNAGVARNYGIDVARGDYLAFLDAGDWFDSNFITRMVTKIMADGADVGICLASEVHHHGDEPVMSPLTCREWEMPAAHPFSPRHACASKIFNITNTSPANKLYSSKFVEAHGLRFQDLSSCNDLLFSFSALAVAGTVSVIPESLVTFDRASGAVFAEPVEYQVMNALSALSALRNFLGERDLLERYKQSFDNFAIDYAVGVSEVFGGLLGDLLGRSGWILLMEEWGLADYPFDYFYYPWRILALEKYRSMLNHSSSAASLSVIVFASSGASSRNLDLCLSSLISQDYKQLNVFVMADTSLDAAQSVAQYEGRTNSSFTVIDLSALSSVGTAFNNVLKSATGDYLMFIDAGDFLAPRFFYENIHLMKETDANLIVPKRYLVRHNPQGSMVNEEMTFSDLRVFGATSPHSTTSAEVRFPVLTGCIMTLPWLCSQKFEFSELQSNVQGSTLR